MQMIVCMDQNNGIGKDDALIYRIHEDHRRFHHYTKDKIVIMGKKTMCSLPHKKLLNRVNIVLTSQKPDESTDEDVLYMNSVEEILQYCDGKEAYVIGGEQTYRTFLPYCDRIYVTYVNSNREADAFFPLSISEMMKNPWSILFRSGRMHDEKENIDFEFIDVHKHKRRNKTEEL